MPNYYFLGAPQPIKIRNIGNIRILFFLLVNRNRQNEKSIVHNIYDYFLIHIYIHNIIFNLTK